MNAADTEKIKMRATYCNNVAVGLTVVGVLVPLLTILPRLGNVVERIFGEAPFEFVEIATAIGIAIAMVFAFTGAQKMRKRALEILEHLTPAAAPPN